MAAMVFDNLPQELLDYILDFLHHERTTLKNCSQVCKAWLNESRRHLFRIIILRCSQQPQNSVLNRFIQFTMEAPYLATDIRELWLMFHQNITTDCILSLLKVLPNLRSLTIKFGCFAPSPLPISSSGIKEYYRRTSGIRRQIHQLRVISVQTGSPDLQHGSHPPEDISVTPVQTLLDILHLFEDIDNLIIHSPINPFLVSSTPLNQTYDSESSTPKPIRIRKLSLQLIPGQICNRFGANSLRQVSLKCRTRESVKAYSSLFKYASSLEHAEFELAHSVVMDIETLELLHKDRLNVHRCTSLKSFHFRLFIHQQADSETSIDFTEYFNVFLNILSGLSSSSSNLKDFVIHFIAESGPLPSKISSEGFDNLIFMDWQYLERSILNLDPEIFVLDIRDPEERCFPGFIESGFKNFVGERMKAVQHILSLGLDNMARISTRCMLVE
ncbi:hypothetical protein C8Q75DRAFT_469334 [Abortiporus biennis]|nr:hypothetical protein C8Q75DRAFT_469334 [Abortiporus biennis]